MQELKEWLDPLGVHDAADAEDLISKLLLPVWVVISTKQHSSSNSFLFGINKIFRTEKDAFNFVKDELQKKPHYKHKSEEFLDDLAGEYIQEIIVEDSY